MSCQPTCSSSFGGIAYPQSAQGNVKSKTFRICAARAGHADPFTAWGPIIVLHSDSAKVKADHRSLTLHSERGQH